MAMTSMRNGATVLSKNANTPQKKDQSKTLDRLPTSSPPRQIQNGQNYCAEHTPSDQRYHYIRVPQKETERFCHEAAEAYDFHLSIPFDTAEKTNLKR